MRLTNDVAAVAFVGDNADGVVAESRLAEALDGWGECRGEIGDRRGATTAGTKGAASSLKLSLCIWAIKTRWKWAEDFMGCKFAVLRSFCSWCGSS